MRLHLPVLGLLLTFATHAAEYSMYHFLYPYDGNVQPLDLSKAALGATPGEACAQRSADEITGGYNNPVHPLLYVGMLADGSCGYQWLNTTPNPPVVINTSVVRAQLDTCTTISQFVAPFPTPPLCPIDCPDGMKNENLQRRDRTTSRLARKQQLKQFALHGVVVSPQTVVHAMTHQSISA